MAKPTVIWRYNNTITDSDYATLPDNFATITPGSYTILWLGSNPAGIPHPSSEQLSEAGILAPETGKQKHTKCFIRNSITNGGGTTFNLVNLCSDGYVGGSSRYVFCISFSGPTVTEPTLEFWANPEATNPGTSLTTLGNGSPSGSYVNGATTTAGAPSTWKKLAGNSAVDYYLLLNDGANKLTAAKDLYFTCYMQVPPGLDHSIDESPYMILRYMWQ